MLPKVRAGLAAFTLAGLVLLGCAVFKPLPRPSRLEDRLRAFPRRDLPLEQPARIIWDRHQIPFIEAGTDHDAAFLLGMVQAHLRLGQMELLRRISQGRISEIAGPFTRNLDEAVRIFDFGAAGAEIARTLPAPTRAWLQAFIAGVNCYIERAAELPHEFALFGMERTPWTLEEIITLSRLYSADVNWIAWLPVLLKEDPAERENLWRMLVAMHSDGWIGGAGAAQPALAGLAALSRSGSNSLVISPARSKTSSALIASDPHLGITFPNLWLLFALKSPSYHMLGMTLPAMPFAALGRNPDVAWGGTNMRALSTSFYTVARLDKSEFKEREHIIKTRFWFDRRITARSTPYGPVLSDASLFKGGGPAFAVKWLGHRPSDEISAFLAANRARDVFEFAAAFKDYAVSAQNLLAADTAGNIAKVYAAAQAQYASAAEPKLLLDPADPRDAWQRVRPAAEIAPLINPARGYIASGNARPPAGLPLNGCFFSPPDREQRMAALVESLSPLGVGDLKRLQTDTVSEGSLGVLRSIRERVREAELTASLSSRARGIWEELAGWDGSYQASLAAPALFEEWFAPFAEELLMRELGDRRLVDDLRSSSYLKRKIVRIVSASSPDVIAEMLKRHLEKTAAACNPETAWGDLHSVAVAHPAERIPLIGGRYRFRRYAADGTTDSLLKTAHAPLKDGAAPARYGSVARHISDLSDRNENYFALLGGQDGWLNSSTALDQLELWRRKEYIRLPLEAAKFREIAAAEWELGPGERRRDAAFEGHGGQPASLYSTPRTRFQK